MADTPDEFRFRHPVPVRFRDIDGVGHVHHGMSLIYFEEARWAYWRHVVGDRTIDEVEYVMGEANIRWVARIEWPQTLSVGVKVTEIGTKSFRMRYEITGDDGTLLARGDTAQVMYDYERGESIAMPAEVRARLAGFDGPFEGGNADGDTT